MKQVINYLSGNVPGGIGLYLLLVAVIFLVLYSISRQNELFTGRHLRMWFGGIWLLLTAGYLSWWVSDPPPGAFQRYGAWFYAQESEDRWLSSFFRDAVAGRLRPYRSATHYFFPQRWTYLAESDCATSPFEPCRDIAGKLPLDEAVIGEIQRRGDGHVLVLSRRQFPENSLQSQTEIPFSAAAPDRALDAILNWLSPHFPVLAEQPDSLLVNPDWVLAKDAFFQGDYRQGRQRSLAALSRHPNHPQIRKWYYYNRIREARQLRSQEETANPYETQQSRWRQMAEEARAFLIPLAKQNFDSGREDPLLSNMIAESFILEEYYGDAEEFLKIAFGENPFLLEALENFTLLHESRYRDLPFQNRQELMSRLLNICPMNEKILQQYIEKLLLNLQVNEAPEAEIKSRLERALALNPRSVTALMLQGRYYNTRFEYRRALQTFLKADSIAPGRALLQYNLGVTYFKLKEQETAEEYFRKAVQLGDYLDAHLYLGVIYQERGQYQKALQHFRYRVAQKRGDDDYYAVQAMKGIRECLEALNIPIPE